MVCVTYFDFVLEGNSRVLAPGGLCLEGLIMGVFFGFRIWGAYFCNFEVREVLYHFVIGARLGRE